MRPLIRREREAWRPRGVSCPCEAVGAGRSRSVRVVATAVAEARLWTCCIDSGDSPERTASLRHKCDWFTSGVVVLGAQVVFAVVTSDPPVRLRQVGSASNLCTAVAWSESERARTVGGAAAGAATGGELVASDLCSAAARPGSGRVRTVGGAAAGAATGGELVVTDLCSAAARPGPGRARTVGGAAAGAAPGGELVMTD